MANSTLQQTLTTIFGDDEHVTSDVSTDGTKTIDQIVDSAAIPFATFGLHISGNIKDLDIGNNTLALGWLNTNKQYGYVLVLGFAGCYFGRRMGSSTFTMTKMA